MNETQSVVGVICASYDTFFEAEKKIADCIKERKEDVVDMTVAELAQASGTSDATVSRFCRRCGFKGFQNLKMALAKEVMEEQQKAVQVSNEIDRKDMGQSLQNILANKVAELTDTVNLMDEAALEQALTLLEQADLVQVAAVGNTIPVAMDCAFKLNQLGIRAVSGTIWDGEAARALNLTKKDVLLVISNSGTSKRLQALAEGARENGAKIILVTNNGASPLARISNVKLITATREKLLTEHFWFSRLTATLIVEVLYLFLLASRKDAAEHIRRHETVIRPDKEVR
ncbi:MAG: MurR/RpiR family transcriptional regulator [Lachnospiraceae bacterium]|nr:MurR/RpiR family transcriptional regulator [Lachnospiraceae bacterium]